jgi:ribosomal protein S18 acetylase RimI-like enzyme
MGHVDLRAHQDSGITHRTLLGMGVGEAYRGRGLSRQLLEFACLWVRASEQIDWLDLEVLSANLPALSLYQSAGFEQLCEFKDMYRIDGQPEAVIRMTAPFSG